RCTRGAAPAALRPTPRRLAPPGARAPLRHAAAGARHAAVRELGAPPAREQRGESGTPACPRLPFRDRGHPLGANDFALLGVAAGVIVLAWTWRTSRRAVPRE